MSDEAVKQAAKKLNEAFKANEIGQFREILKTDDGKAGVLLPVHSKPSKSLVDIVVAKADSSPEFLQALLETEEGQKLLNPSQVNVGFDHNPIVTVAINADLPKMQAILATEAGRKALLMTDDEFGTNALYYAAIESPKEDQHRKDNRPNVVKAILATEEGKSLIEAIDQERNNLLHSVLAFHKPPSKEVMDLLLVTEEAKRAIFAKNGEGDTPLALAALYSNHEAAAAIEKIYHDMIQAVEKTPSGVAAVGEAEQGLGHSQGEGREGGGSRR